MLDCSPCLLHARRAGPWLTCGERRLTLDELLRLQGFPDTTQTLVTTTPHAKLTQMLGNAMTVNSVERILHAMLSTPHYRHQYTPYDRFNTEQHERDNRLATTKPSKMRRRTGYAAQRVGEAANPGPQPTRRPLDTAPARP